MRVRRDGVVLLEALVAIAVLGTVASAAAWKTAETLHAVRRTHAREAEVRAAQRLMSAVYLWPRDDLDRHLGNRAQGKWTMRVDRVNATLYEIALIDTFSAGVLLRTTLFRELEYRP
jgi:type II secretory pathway pseudopilin PulG